MITDAAIADLCNGIYAYSGNTPIAWDHFDDGSDSDGVCWALKRIDDFAVVVFRGSVTLQDWIRDAQALPMFHDELGPVHSGFYSGMRTVQRELASLLITEMPMIVAGHSLGAARATIFSGLLTLDMKPPVRRVVFGEPLSGFSKLATILSAVPGASYRNGDGKMHDPVCSVPFAISPVFDYRRVTPLIDVIAIPAMPSYDAADLHHMPLYQQSLKALAL